MLAAVITCLYFLSSRVSRYIIIRIEETLDYFLLYIIIFIINVVSFFMCFILSIIRVCIYTYFLSNGVITNFTFISYAFNTALETSCYLKRSPTGPIKYTELFLRQKSEWRVKITVKEVEDLINHDRYCGKHD